MKKILLYTLCTLWFQLCQFPIFGQTQINLTTVGSGTWYPPPGAKSFYVETWGGGAGGSGSYGGGGGSYSRSTVFTVTSASYTWGYSYTVGAGGGPGADGQDTKFDQCWAHRGLKDGGAGTRYIGGLIATSHTGGTAGKNYVTCCDNWGGGGGGSAFTYQGGSNGENGNLFYNGKGGGGTANGGDGANKSGGGNGGIPGGGGGGNGGSGARGEIRIFITCDYSPGTIGNPHTVPFPQELPAGTNFITNVASPTGFGYTYSWERSTDNVNWTLIPGANQLTLAIPEISQDTYFRRVINGCDPTKNRSNSVLIKVFSQANGKKNGTISGKVVSKNGTTGVAGITITARKTIALKGSPANFTYTTTTDGDGNYSLQNLFYGDVSNGDPGTVSFTITPSKTGHDFSPVNRTVSLSNTNPTVNTSTGFTDNTVYVISGRVTQNCADCLPGYTGPFGVGGAKITPNQNGTIPGFTDSLNPFTIGNYAITVADPLTYTLTPTYLNHQFSPSSRIVPVTADVPNQNFSDTTTRVISGKLTDVAGNHIGSGSLLFEGIFKRKDSADIGTFRKLATISPSNGTYSVRLPAGSHYKVTVQSFSSLFATNDDRYIREDSLKNFFNKWAVEPLIDISTKDSVRNLVYHRPPFFVLTGLADTACNTNQNLNPGIVFRTNVPRYMNVNVFEGPPSLGHKIQTTTGNNSDTLGDYLRIYTNVTKRTATANPDTIFFRLRNSASGAMLDSFLLPGAPNTIAPHTKPFEVHYIDRYGRKATAFKPKATVVGVFNPTSTFTTAFPEKPTLILHAPPGDQSYSYWSKDTSIQTAIGYSVAKEDGRDGFVNVSVGPTISLGDPIGNSVAVEVIATGSYTHEYRTNFVKGNEVVETTTNKIEFQTNKSGVVNGTSGDVYIGTGSNYILGKSIYVDFIEGKPVNACEIEVNEKLFLAPKAIRTEFAYAEDHILNVIIPQQQRLAEEASDPITRSQALTQVSVWQQVIENNKINKKNAEFVRNRSFSNGVIIDESQTSTKEKSNSITYDVFVGDNIAFELGLRFANIGATGGANITIRETTTNDTTTTNSTSTTMGYRLQDSNPGDFYSVDIKKDPVYGTPVFDLVAGTSSCPPEEGAQNRDQPQIMSGDMRLENLDPNTAHFFTINLANKSESGEDRFYNLSVDATTSEGLVISSSGSSNLVTNQVPFYLAYGESKDVQIKVEKFNKLDKIFSYPNVEFYLTDNCGTLFVPNTISTSKISFNYASSCGSITLSAPEDSWVVNAGASNLLPITMTGYTLSGIDSVTLQYKKKGPDTWKNAISIKKAAITDPNSHSFNWNISALKDSVYEIRLRKTCLDGSIIFSETITGVIDRQGPSLVGKPQPASQVFYPNVSEISFTYNESISNTNLNQGVVEFIRRSNGTSIPFSVKELDGALVITPLASLGNVRDSFRVIVRNIFDLYGNVKIKPDTLFFTLDLTPQVVYTGSNVATVHVVNPSIAENNSGKIALHFRLREKTNKVTKVYFNLAGTATYNTDYQMVYDTILQKKCLNIGCSQFVQLPVFNDFISSPGFVHIDSNKTEAIVYIDPLEDFDLESNETVLISLLAGPNYKLQDSASALGTINNALPPCSPGNILFVKSNASGNNTGISWDNAFTSLATALSVASSCNTIQEIWVAKGTYKPTTGSDRTASFNLVSGVAVYGGFSGNETQLSQRNWVANPTILSGDIGILQNNSDNTLNLVKANNCNSATKLSGFTLTGGNANGVGVASGGGLVSTNSSFTLEYCNVNQNVAGFEAGGLMIFGGSPKFQNCTFSGNSGFWAGAVYFSSGSTATVLNCLFSGNTAYGEGSAILCNGGSNVNVINCTMSGNTGSAFANFGSSVPVIANSIIWANSGTSVYIENASFQPQITNSIIQGGYSGVGNLNTNPLFIRSIPNDVNLLGDLRLLSCSPAINTGSNAALPVGTTTDLSGLSRTALTTVDMGAYERQTNVLPQVIYVDATASGANDGSSWANAYRTLQAAANDLNNCATGSTPTINMATGTYLISPELFVNFDKLNARIFGGFPNGGGTRNAAANTVIIRGEVRVLKNALIDGVRLEKLP